ncbi:hypothetical protein ABBQ38_000822 [Trebouxia sp. C0009 RCD-2024]
MLHLNWLKEQRGALKPFYRKLSVKQGTGLNSFQTPKQDCAASCYASRSSPAVQLSIPEVEGAWNFSGIHFHGSVLIYLCGSVVAHDTLDPRGNAW